MSNISSVNIKLLEMLTNQTPRIKKFRRTIEANADDIFKILRSKSTYKVLRGRILGSAVLKSPLEYFNQLDFELVIFLDETPPFNHILDDFEKVLQKHKCKKHEFKKISRNQHSIQFQMKDILEAGDLNSRNNNNSFISFNLLPASNLLRAEDEEKKDFKMEDIQTERTLEVVSKLPLPSKNSGNYNSSFAEGYLAFVENQNGFVDQVVLLAQLWNRKVAWKGKERLRERSKIIEIMAISSALVEIEDALKAEREPNIYIPLKDFLTKFIYFDRLIHEIFKEQLSLPSQQPYKDYVEKTYPEDEPVILDPTNPFNNLATNFTEEMKEAFLSHAKVTLSAIRNYKRYCTGRWFNLEGTKKMHVRDKLVEITLGQKVNFGEFQDKIDLNADEVFDILRFKSIYEISRGRILGTVGLPSPFEDLNQPDFDLVIFVNNQSPPFNYILDDFQKVLLQHQCKKHNFEILLRTEYYLKIKMKQVFKNEDEKEISGNSNDKNGFMTFNLYPAINLLLPQEEENFHLNREDLQTERILKWVSELPNEFRSSNCYKSSFVEGYISFLDKQSEFVHDVIRLAKLWNRKVIWSEKSETYDNGDRKELTWRSKIIELVAISSALTEEDKAKIEGRPECMFATMQRFLMNFIYFEKLSHAVFMENASIHPQLPYKEFFENANSGTDSVILDPVNPFDNLILLVSDEAQAAFRSHAKLTLNSIKNYKRFNKGRFYNLEGYFGV